MKRKWRNIAIFILLHCILSATLLGAVRVSQRGYNTMHHDQVRMAGITLTQGQAHLQLLQQTYTIPVTVLSEDSILYYAAYFLTDPCLHIWMWCSDQFMNLF